jgi:hypothetical protein
VNEGTKKNEQQLGTFAWGGHLPGVKPVRREVLVALEGVGSASHQDLACQPPRGMRLKVKFARAVRWVKTLD